MGSFALEEGINNMLVMLGDDCQFNLHEVRDFNVNMDSVIEANSVQRGQNNIVSAPSAGAGGAGGQHQPQQHQQQHQQQPGMGM